MSETKVEETNLGKEPCPDTSEGKFSARSILSAIGNRLFSRSQESTEVVKPPAVLLDPPLLIEKCKALEKSHSETVRKKKYRKIKVNELPRYMKRAEKEFKTKYNTGIGNIMRNWISLIYCILFLRMNLIKFILGKNPTSGEFHHQFHSQILLETKTMYKIVSKAQKFSQERSAYLWSLFQKLLFSQMILKEAQEKLYPKEPQRDWKSANSKLQELTTELKKVEDHLKSVQKTKNSMDNTAKAKLTKLQSLINSKNAEIWQVIEQITECKKREAEMKKNFHLDLESSRELKSSAEESKYQNLINVKKTIQQLKAEQQVRTKEYSDRIHSLKWQIKETETRIESEKAEAKKLRSDIEGFGDFYKGKAAIKES